MEPGFGRESPDVTVILATFEMNVKMLFVKVKRYVLKDVYLIKS